MGATATLRTAETKSERPDDNSPTMDEIVARHSVMVSAVARRVLGARPEVDDVVQETWIAYLCHGHRIADPAATGPWLARVATNHALRVAQARARLIPVADVPAGRDRNVDDFDVVERLHRGEVRAAVHQAIASLPRADRDFLDLLADDQALRYREISRRIGRPIGTLGPQRGRLIRKLRQQPGLRRLGDLLEPAQVA